MGRDPLNKFYDIVVAEGFYSKKEYAEFYLNYLFSGITFSGKKMLEIGGGAGLFSLYASAMGAELVVCLEPELAGSGKVVTNKFERMKYEAGLDNIYLLNSTFQDYDAGKHRFDIILSHSSINHLDEDACMELGESKDALEIYKYILKKLYDISSSGADLIIADCSRYNLFGSIGLKNPIVPTIEWRKHQSPWFWAKLLRSVGFCDSGIRWLSYKRFGTIGKIILSNTLVAHCLSSFFFLNMKKVNR